MPADAKLVRDLFLAVAELPVTERAAYLTANCSGDAELQAAVARLLAAHDQPASVLVRPAPGIPTADYVPIMEKPGTRIGSYKLLQQIGEGGMGVVYMAEQEQPVRRKVALKIIKPGMDSRSVVARFEAERQALAVMDHLHIAKVFDGGVTDSGRPYFVMELVHGVPITQFCDDNQLTPQQRLELFVPVCQAIQHAHQKGIIHRDLKPSNVLVTLYDDKPVPKVIDFGVAKAVEQRLTEKTLFTQFGTLVGTFEYMSPEQAELNAFGVDTRSDIYSLGVLLYELLTGTTPLERQRLRQAALDELVRLIKEEEPPRPSVRLSTSGNLPKIAAARKTEPGRLSKLVRGEIDWIVMKCLEKDRTRRYETAVGLARDVQRYLHDEPVEACPPSAGYRLRKFTRRHKRGVIFTALTVVFALLSVFFQTIDLIRATRAEADAARERDAARVSEEKALDSERNAQQERDAKEQALQEAKASAAEAKTVLAFFQDKVLAAGRPKELEDGGLGKDVTLRQAIDAATAEIAEAFQTQPLAEASVRDVLGLTYRYLRDYPQAIQQLERAWELRQAKLGADHCDTLTSMFNLAEAYWNAGKLDQALPLAEETLRRRKATPGPVNIDTLKSMLILAEVHSGLGKVDQALPLFDETLQLRKAMLGPTHLRTLVAMGCRANAYLKAGKLDQALPLLKETLELRQANLGPEASYTLQAMRFLAEAYDTVGEYPEALRLGQKLLDIQRRKLSVDDPALAVTLATLGLCLLHAQQPMEAEPLLRECLALHQKNQADRWTTFQAQSLLGGSLLVQQKYVEAEPLLLQGYEGLQQRKATIPAYDKVRLTEALERLVQLYEAWGKPDEAAKWQKVFEEAKAAEKPSTRP
jgi:serine/threonine protein kinase/tetratricopeptide (TPR) repeat protein